MSSYRKGSVLGLTVAEIFILLTFLLLIALFGLVQMDEYSSESSKSNPPRVWVRPDEIEALVNAADDALAAKKRAEEALSTVERERDAAREEADQARSRQQEAELMRDQVEENLAVLRRKGENPPCWYQVVSDGEGGTREKPFYAFNVAIYEESIELAPRTAPPGGAFDDGGGMYADEWKQLRLDELPYGKALSDTEFTAAVSNMVSQAKNRQVRTYECVFSVMVWDKTPNDAKERWKYAHDRVIEGLFGAYTALDLPWRGVGD